MINHCAIALLLLVPSVTSSADPCYNLESIKGKPPAFLSSTTPKSAMTSISRKSISLSSYNKPPSSVLQVKPLFSTTPTTNQILDWENYQLCQNYKKAGGILYKQSILTPWEFEIISSELNKLLRNYDENNYRHRNSNKSSSNKNAQNLKLENEDSSSFATNRIGAQIGKDTEIYRVLSSDEGSLSKLINILEGAKMVGTEDEDGDLAQNGNVKLVLAPDIPVEVRFKAGVMF